MAKLIFNITTLGCRVNQRESQLLAQQLQELGWEKSSEEKSNKVGLAILNTCVITHKAQREVRKNIRRLTKNFPKAKIAVIGCAVDAKQKLGIKLPAADYFFTNAQKRQIANQLHHTLYTPGVYKADTPGVYKNQAGRVFIKVQDGCQQFCTYCIVPFLRSNPQSKPPHQVVKEINQLKNAPEVIICGINLASYGKDLPDQPSFASLLEKILAETNVPRISLSSLTPSLVDKNLLELYQKDQQNQPRLSSYFHLALQSASPKILRLMNRPETNLSELSRRLKKIKKIIPYFTLRADIIVGFPQESKADFTKTLDFVKDNQIAFGHVFRFSARPQTTATKMIKKGDWPKVSEKIKKKRSKTVRKTIAQIRRRQAKKLSGKYLQTLVLTAKDNKQFGLTQNYWPVEISTTKNLKNHFVKVKITDFTKNKLVGKIKE